MCPNTFFHLPPFSANFIYIAMTFLFLPSDSVTQPCSVVTGLETWILSCLWLAAYTGEWWTVYFSTLHWQALIEQYAGQKADLSVYHAVWMFTMERWNHFIICHNISPLIPLSLYLALVCIWIVRAVLRPPRPWNIVCCVILTWAEHSGSVFPIVFVFCF